MTHETGEAPRTITRLLGEMKLGSRAALDALLPLVYDELVILAHQQRQRWRGDHTLDTTALVHEAYLKLVNQEAVAAESRAHFFALASRVMRHILCNHARDRRARKRGGDFRIVGLHHAEDIGVTDSGSADDRAERLLALDAALSKMEVLHPRRSRVVECRIFGGMTVDDTAAALAISPRTVKREWAAAREWLRGEIGQDRQPHDASDPLEQVAADLLPALLDGLAQHVYEDMRPGERVAQYEIVETLGRGGMGVVYKAHDSRLDRHVALKFPPFHVASDESAKARLMYEARAASALDHPNICTVYDIGELDDGRIFLVLACYDGETLKQKIARGSLTVEDVGAIALQIAQAISAAHRRGIVHRDIKPSNVLITSEGAVKILDFGIAKLRDSDPTSPGATAGTIAYMSPEQTRGESSDARTDLWSIGVVIYEMLAGKRPFAGETRERQVHAIRSEPPAPLKALRTDVFPALVHVVDRCLQKDREARYQSADELLVDLRAIGSGDGTGAPAIRVVVMPLAGAAGSADDQQLADGLGEELSARLSALKGLHVIGRASAMSVSRSSKEAVQIGRELGAKAIVQGSVSRSGDRITATFELLDVTRSEPLWTTRQEVPLTELQNTLRTVTWRIADELSVRSYNDERRRLAKRGSENAAAYELYLKGRHFWNKRDRASLQQARDHFQQALDLDPVFAQAWTGLADTFSVLGSYMLLQPEDAYPRARAAAERALAIDEELAEAHASLATILADYYWNWPVAGQHYRRALALNPNYATARLWYAGYLRDLGQFDEALTQVRAARELDPLSLPMQAAEGMTLYLARRYTEAVAVYRNLIEITPTFTYAHFLLALALTQQRKYTEALDALQQAAKWGDDADVRGLTGHIHGALGRREEALQMLHALDDAASRQRGTPFHRSMIHAALGESERVLELLEQACAAHAKPVRLLRVEPMFDVVRADPRFQAILEKVGLTDAAVARALAS